MNMLRASFLIITNLRHLFFSLQLVQVWSK